MDGRCWTDDSAKSGAHAGDRYRIEFLERSAQAEEAVGSTLFRQVISRPDGWEVELAPSVDSRMVVTALNAMDIPLIRFARVEPSLHEIFVQQVGTAKVALRRQEVVHA